MNRDDPGQVSSSLVKLRMRSVLTFVLAASLLAAACEDTPTTPTTPTATDLFFTSQLMAGGSVSRTFTTTRTGDVKVLFTSLLPEASAVVAVSLGTFDGTVCTPTTTVMSVQGKTDPVITTSLPAGNYCIRIADPGAALTKTNDFSITVNYPTGTGN